MDREDDIIYCPRLIELLCSDLGEARRFMDGSIRQELEHRAAAGRRVTAWLAELRQEADRDGLTLQAWLAREQAKPSEALE